MKQHLATCLKALGHPTWLEVLHVTHGARHLRLREVCRSAARARATVSQQYASPAVNLATWSLKVHGDAVENPLALACR